MEDYAGRACFDKSSKCIITIGEMMKLYNKGGKTRVFKGVDLDSKDES